MKWLGAALILAASTLLGLTMANRYRERPRQLRQLKVALQSLEAEIVYGLTPLKEAAENIAKQIQHPLADMFASFAGRLEDGESSVAEAWSESLEAVWPHTCLEKEEFEILKQFGATLGRHDRDHQQKQIKLTILHLEREEMEAKDAQMRNEKMMKSLGILAGLLFIILLM